MDRRHFATGADVALVPTSALPRKLARSSELPWFSTYLANVEQALGDAPVPVHPHEPVHLVAVAGDIYDPHAVAVTTPDGRMLGRLPTSQSRIIRPLLEAGRPLAATVGEVRHIPRPAIRIEITVGEPLAA